MKKTYISPATDVSACLPFEFLIGAMDMSDPIFNNPTAPVNNMSFDEYEDDRMELSPPNLWIE